MRNVAKMFLLGHSRYSVCVDEFDREQQHSPVLKIAPIRQRVWTQSKKLKCQYCTQ